jgi:hypothetical protein
MMALIKREEIIASKPTIASELAKIQKADYDEDVLEHYKETNEGHLYSEQYDFIDHEIALYNSHYKVIGLEHSDIKTFTASLTSKLTELFTAINASQFFIIAYTKRDFFGNRENKYRPLVKAYKMLEQIVGGNTYKEAFSLDLKSLPEFVEILFWITRCDPSIPEYIYLFDSNEKVKLSLCKYGNIHLTEFGEETLTNEKLTSLGWRIIEGEEYDNFSKNGRIKGRRIKV